ncbi:hypothetical protein KXQ82_06755 [Mucilaginibacter sp. HMF5004]|uniref:hypothetical protein n=1 Tax=Mucilaginibacter rivuli TaxID=2857527 RepID=UPI001C602669|nr:hypothetical protein [Mucilaginibacter rivuli]MBW4889406.1 hypothetical protein [Mucilaginibacter rivuli]
MLKKSLNTFLGLLLSATCFSQSNPVSVPKNIKLPADSVRLIKSLNSFLSQMEKPGKDNAFVLKENLIETAALIDEMKGVENAGAAKPNFYKCYLTNVVPVDSNTYLIQLSYLAVDNATPILKASFKLIAEKKSEQYFFNSPLKRNTLTWQVKKTGSFTVYRNTTVKIPKLDKFIKKAIEYDKRVKAPNYPTSIYYCDNFENMLELMGVAYRADYNSINHANLSTFEDQHSLYLIGAPADDITAFDLHDLWHSRLHHVVSTTVIYRPLDEACAYLYGGSWGIMDWHDIFKKFKTLMGNDHDWLKALNAHTKFGDVVHAPLYTDYVIEALIVQKLEKEKGFPAVISLLSCGKAQPDNENLFKALNSIAGINKTNFNVVVDKLVADEWNKY